MARWWRSILVLFVLGQVVGCGDPMRTEPGLYPVPIQSHSRFPALPDEKKWHFDVVLPRDTAPNDVFDLEVRRITEEVPKQNVAVANSRENVVEITELTAFLFKEGDRRATISLQLLDLRDFSHNSSIANPMKLVGAIQRQGGIYTLQDSSSFVIGLPGGYGGVSNQRWENGEVRLLRFWGWVDGIRYEYDVCLRHTSGS